LYKKKSKESKAQVRQREGERGRERGRGRVSAFEGRRSGASKRYLVKIWKGRK